MQPSRPHGQQLRILSKPSRSPTSEILRRESLSQTAVGGAWTTSIPQDISNQQNAFTPSNAHNLRSISGRSNPEIINPPGTTSGLLTRPTEYSGQNDFDFNSFSSGHILQRSSILSRPANSFQNEISSDIDSLSLRSSEDTLKTEVSILSKEALGLPTSQVGFPVLAKDTPSSASSQRTGRRDLQSYSIPRTSTSTNNSSRSRRRTDISHPTVSTRPPHSSAHSSSDSYRSRHSRSSRRSVKLVDRFLQFRSDEFEKILKDQSDFSVIGVIGKDCVGKSTIISRFASTDLKEAKFLFPVQTATSILNCSNMTTGIDVYVTKQRTIILDTQPIESASILTSMVQHDQQINATSSHSHQNIMDIQSIEMIFFLLSVCHVVVIVSDWVIDIRLWKLLRTAIMLFQTSSVGEPFLDNSSNPQRLPTCPDIIFAFNKLPEEHLTISAFSRLRDILSKFFKMTNFRKHGAVGNSRFSDFLDGKDSAVNLFCFPHFLSRKDSFEYAISEFVTQVLSMTKLRLASRTSERSWLKNASCVWNEIGTCRALMDYNKTLQNLRIYR